MGSRHGHEHRCAAKGSGARVRRGRGGGRGIGDGRSSGRVGAGAAAMNDQYRGYRYEFLDADSGAGPGSLVDPERFAASAVASGQGAATLGFAGTARKDAAEAAGLATLAGDEFGGGPSVPMVPDTWEPDSN